LSRLENALGLESDGFQASLGLRIYRGSAVGWKMTVNFSHQQSVVSKVVGDEIIVGNRILKPGSAIGEFYGWLLLRDVNQLKPDGTPFIPASELPLYEVASNGWVVNRTTKQAFVSDERFPLGNANPDYLWSVINDFTFKEFLTASVQLDGSVGNEMYNETRQWLYRDAIHSDYEKPLTINGKEGAWSAFYRSVYNPAKWDKNYFVEDASFIRLRTVSVAFDFARAFRIAGIKRLQLVLTGRNLWTSTSYTGLDPEVSSFAVPNPNYGSANQALTRGVDRAALPNSKSYQVTLNIGL
jgi:hypothetical protein